VTDGGELATADGFGAGSPAFTPDGSRVVAEGVRDGTWHVFVGAEPGPGFEALAEGTLAFAPTGSSVAIVARRGDDWRIVVDGRESEPFDALLPGSVPAADGPRAFVAWVVRGESLLKIRAALSP
jgi:hypothetical protein